MSVYLEVDGIPTPIDDCVWAGIAPCGCVNSILNAAGAFGKSPVLTADDARRNWASGSKRKDPDEYRLYSRSTFPWEDFRGNCPHDPKWGRK